MPAIVTHYTFARDLMEAVPGYLGLTEAEKQAFLLGNQGPDPLFYSKVDPLLAPVHRLGNLLHAQAPSRALVSLHAAWLGLPLEQRGIGRAYALGYLAHYVLDATLHPFVYAKEFEVCDAGIPGIDRTQASDLHALVESELDELALSLRWGRTVDTFNPAREALSAAPEVLVVVSALYQEVASATFGLAIPANAFARSVSLFRLGQCALRSSSGLRRRLYGALEPVVRPGHFFVQAMTRRNVERTTSSYANEEGRAWTNPWTGQESTASFWLLYTRALERMPQAWALFEDSGFDLHDARVITEGLNFSGKPVGD